MTTVTYVRSLQTWNDQDSVGAGVNTGTFSDGTQFVAGGTTGTRPDGVKWVVIDITIANGKLMCHIVWVQNGAVTGYDYLSFEAIQAMRTVDANSVGITLPPF